MKLKKFPFPTMLLRRKGVDEHVLLETEQKYILSDQSDFFIREAYKTLRTNVTFSLAGEEGGKVLLVTSAMKSEGKSITSLNLAISYAQMNKRVLLIDCDLRRPKISRLLDLRGSVGLSNVLVSPELKSKVILDTKVPGLQVILAGDVPPNPSELLGSTRMQRLVEELRNSYDYIILDTSPVNMVTDASVLIPYSSGVLLVVRAGQSDRASVRGAVEQLEYSQAKILGFVLNGVDMERRGKYGYRKYRRYGYGYGRGYGYGYGYGYSNRDQGYQ